MVLASNTSLLHFVGACLIVGVQVCSKIAGKRVSSAIPSLLYLLYEAIAPKICESFK